MRSPLSQLWNLPVLPWACVIIRWLRRTFTVNHGNKKPCSLARTTTIIGLRNSWTGAGLKASHLIFFFFFHFDIYSTCSRLWIGKTTQLLPGVFRLSWFAEQPSPTVKLVSAQAHSMYVALWQPPAVWVFNTAGRKTASPRSSWLWGRAVWMLWQFLSPLGPGSQPRANTLWL